MEQSPSVVFPELPTYLFAPSFWGVISLVLTVVLPIAAGLLMKQSWSAGQKGTVLLALASVKTLLEAAVVANAAHQPFNWATSAWTVVINFIIAVTMYFGVWRKTSIQQSAISSGISDSKIIDGQAYPTRR